MQLKKNTCKCGVKVARGVCKRCYMNAYHRYHKTDPQKRRESLDKYYKKHQGTPEQRRAKALKTRYGITPQIYEILYEWQRGCCAICGQHFARLGVDHNHITGRIRGLLCIKCNLAIGYIEACPTFLIKAQEYLE